MAIHFKFVWAVLLALSPLTRGQSWAGLTSSGQINKLIFDEVALSPAFITQAQFHKALNSATPIIESYLSGLGNSSAVPLNVTLPSSGNNGTLFDPMSLMGTGVSISVSKPDILRHYSYFMNNAVKIGRINSTDELSMFLAQALFESAGLTMAAVPECSGVRLLPVLITSGGFDAYNDTALAASNITQNQVIQWMETDSLCAAYNAANPGNNATPPGVPNYFYHGRGFIRVSGASDYQAASEALYGDDQLLNDPEAVARHESLSWGLSAWKWNQYLQPAMSGSNAFGLSIKYLRPNECTGKSSDPLSSAAQTAVDIYNAIFPIFSPNGTAVTSGCFSI